MAIDSSDLTALERRVVRSLMRHALTSWDRENMTAARMFGLQQKGIIVRESGHWRLTTLGVKFASATL
ncbi:hypothetical protein DWU99_05435 [Dyella psychrodurans]|uniref:Uncharacterized protein n=1 Tax=Dyella psychrodurans TaxID=1927960 RepID=A0A370XEE4_9GAMM|nr:hypothetical protein DWU99_05435 [Dyella psychrodurans]